MIIKDALYDYLLRLGDNALILGHRLSEWCGHGPILEQDIAITNIALDFIGQARMLYQYAAEIEGKGKTEDDIAYFRDSHQFRNVLLVEQPNEDWAFTIIRQFLFDTYNFYFHEALLQSNDVKLAAFSEKSLKEITYHLKWSSEWVIRLGDGSQESHQRIQNALNEYWSFHGELLIADEIDSKMAETGIGVNLDLIKPLVEQKIEEILTKATLIKPTSTWMQKGGKVGIHSEYLGFILAEMQSVQRMYPGNEW
ncbi:MAG: 1,2-phenylacetyl-CoA epoxidase subunit PaaC [Saprospiraceae bacterium]